MIMTFLMNSYTGFSKKPKKMFAFFMFLVIQKCISAKEPPNIIVILADDMGWNDVSFHGSDEIPTPNIDALAYNGIILNQHYTPPLCTPSRAAFLTGKYPIHTGMQHYLIKPPDPYGLGLNERLLPQVLSQAGYKSHAIGKWHLGSYKKSYTPTYRGFESFFGFYQGFQGYYDHLCIDDESNFVGFDLRRNLDVDWSSKGKYSTDLFTQEAVNIIKHHDTSNPLFLYLSHPAPHAGNTEKPFEAPDDTAAKFSHIEDPQRRVYAAMVSKLDESVGKVVTALKSKNILNNSIILFMSDNGGPTQDQVHYNRASNYPLRGMKTSLWEGGVRVAAAVWSPLIIKPQRVANQLMYITDWMPTLYSLAGLDPKDLGDIDGIDMWEELSKDLPSPRTEFVYNIDDFNECAVTALRYKDWKYIKGHAYGGYEHEYNQWYGESGQNSGITYNPQDILTSETGIALSDFINEQNEYKHLKPLQIASLLDSRSKAQIVCNNFSIKCIPTESPCLFDLKNDPCEMVNLAEMNPSLLQTFEESLRKTRKTIVKARNKPMDNLANPIFWNNTWTFWRDEKIIPFE